MSRRRTERLIVTTVTPDGARRSPDRLIVEEPMTVQLDGVTVATTMRTPGNDFELAVGFCHTEGLLDGAAVEGIKYCGTGSALATEFNVVTVDTGGSAPEPTPRLGLNCRCKPRSASSSALAARSGASLDKSNSSTFGTC